MIPRRLQGPTKGEKLVMTRRAPYCATAASEKPSTACFTPCSGSALSRVNLLCVNTASTPTWPAASMRTRSFQCTFTWRHTAHNAANSVRRAQRGANRTGSAWSRVHPCHAPLDCRRPAQQVLAGAAGKRVRILQTARHASFDAMAKSAKHSQDVRRAAAVTLSTVTKVNGYIIPSSRMICGRSSRAKSLQTSTCRKRKTRRA